MIIFIEENKMKQQQQKSSCVFQPTEKQVSWPYSWSANSIHLPSSLQILVSMKAFSGELVDHYPWHFQNTKICQYSEAQWACIIELRALGFHMWRAQRFPVEYQWRVMEYKRWTGSGFVLLTDLDLHIQSITWFCSDQYNSSKSTPQKSASKWVCALPSNVYSSILVWSTNDWLCI